MERIQGTQENTSREQTKSLNSIFGSPTQPKEIYLFIYILGQWASFIVA
jgi:hypothetical protein